eukprot:6847719-Prymnesium_polylepis.1
MRSMMCPDPIASPPRARHSLRTSVDIESRARLIHEACYFNGSLSPKRAVQTPSGEVSEAETDAFPAFDGTLGIEPAVSWMGRESRVYVRMGGHAPVGARVWNPRGGAHKFRFATARADAPCCRPTTLHRGTMSTAA